MIAKRNKKAKYHPLITNKDRYGIDDYLNNFDSIDTARAELSIKEQQLFDKALRSDDPSDIVKAMTKLSTSRSDYGNYGNQGNLYSGKSILMDPLGMSNQGGYLSKSLFTNTRTLRNMARTPFIKSIIETRVEQVAAFGSYSEHYTEMGWVIEKKDSSNENVENKDLSEIKRIRDFLISTGVDENRWVKDDFNKFLRKITKDTLELDSMTFEIVSKKNEDLFEFFATDGATFYYADPREQLEKGEEINGYFPMYVQVYQGSIINEYYPWELAYGVRNTSSDILRNGYGRSELEDLIQIVTWQLYGMQYTGAFFSQGSAPKGILKIQGNINERRLQEFKQQWQAQVQGIKNAWKTPIMESDKMEWIDLQKCLSGNSIVFTKEGCESLNSLLGTKDEIYTSIWDGKNFNNARVYKTGEKKLSKLTLSNRLSIETSPDHRFLILKENGPEWIERKNIKINDYLVVNKKPIENNKETLYYKDKEVEIDLIEYLGWITGDGTIGNNKNSERIIRSFTHPIKEVDILEKHKRVCKKYGINFKVYHQILTEKTKEKLKLKYRIKNIIGNYPILYIMDSDFYNWVIELGFNPSKEGKVIPKFLYSGLAKFRRAFLRGFFSADGHISKNGSIVNICISNNKLLNETRLLLISEGIRTTIYKSKIRQGGFSIGKEDNLLIIKDKTFFFERISFMQDYKKDRQLKRQKPNYTNHAVSRNFLLNFAIKVKSYNKILPLELRLSKKDLHDLLNILHGSQPASISKIISYAKKINYPIPSYLEDYNFERVIELTDTDTMIDMVDVEMFNNTHQFIANGIIVHNSNRDMEFNNWISFLVKVSCAIYKIDPSEIGMPMGEGADGKGSQGLHGDATKEKVLFSKEKGLKPLLKLIEQQINTYIVNRLNPEYKFSFTGTSFEDPKARLEDDIKKLGNFMKVDEIRKKYNLDELGEDNGGNLVLNPVWWQAKAQAQMGGEESNDYMEDEYGGEGSPYESDWMNEGENPFLKSINEATSTLIKQMK